MRIEPVMLAVALAACAAPEPTATPREARELAGRSQGPAQRCVPIEASQGLRISDSDGHTVIYGSGRTIWANNLGPSCGFAVNDILISEPSGSYYCRGDVVHSMDRYSHIPGPACVLGDFVPYNR